MVIGMNSSSRKVLMVASDGTVLLVARVVFTKSIDVAWRTSVSRKYPAIEKMCKG
jgi:hypothetical protein